MLASIQLLALENSFAMDYYYVKVQFLILFKSIFIVLIWFDIFFLIYALLCVINRATRMQNHVNLNQLN